MQKSDEMLRIDEVSRNRIREDIDTNFFVEAAAGSGKTSSLVARMMSMVRSGKDISRITAITFTVNAANEFYRRFRDKLREAVCDEKLDPVERERYITALENIDLCFMGTIDSFCEEVCSEHPFEAGIPADAHIARSDELEGIYRTELAKVQFGSYGEKILSKYRRLDRYFNNSDATIFKTIDLFMGTRDCKRIYNPYLFVSLEKEFADVKQILSKVAEIASADIRCLYTEGTNAKSAAEFFITNEHIFSEDWDSNSSQLLYAVTKLKKFRFRDNPESLGIPGNTLFRYHDGNGKYKWYETVFDPGSRLSELENCINEQKYSALMEFMDDFTDILAQTLKKRGILDFTGYQICLRDMLRRDAAEGGKLAAHIYRRHSYFLIDEFQDTAPIQAETFFRLTSEKPENDWRDCVPRPGSLFIVGDPKQSIYRFRGADVSSFLGVRSMFNGKTGEVLHLYRNFRSTDTMCRNFNSIFSELMPEESKYQSAFVEIPVVTAKHEEGISGIYEYKTSEKAEDCSHDVARLIRTLTGSKNCRIWSARDECLRPVKYSDIMVITANKKVLKAYMNACAEDGIPIYVEGETVFSECPALKMISTVLNAVAEPDNAMKVYAALMCGLFDIDDMALSKFCLNGGSLKIKTSPADSDGEQSMVTDAMNRLAPLTLLAQSASPVELFYGILTGLPVTEKAGTENLEYVYYAAELLSAEEKSGNVVDAVSAAAFVSGLTDNTSGIERSMRLNQENNSVHFANLHKIKGLESPVVILAAMKERDDTPLGYTHREGNCDLRYEFEIKDKTNSYNIALAKTGNFAEQKDTESLFLKAENDRLIYVAGTRSGNILIVPSLPKNDKNGWETFRKHSIGNIYDVFTEEEPVKQQKIFSAADAAEDIEGKTVLPNYRVKEKTYAIKRPSSLDLEKVPRKEVEETATSDNTCIPDFESADSGRSDAGLIGTMVHRVMEILAVSRNKAEENVLVASVLGEYDYSLDKAEEYEKMLHQVVKTVRSGGYEQTTDVCRDVLGELMSADEVYCEVPICLKQGNDIVHGFIDVIYCKAGKWHILDYKTDASADGIAERHAGQLAAYVKAFYELTGNNADAKVYHMPVK